MTHERFNSLLEENFEQIRKVLAKKQAEYNLDEDRLSHFKRAAVFAQTTPEKVCPKCRKPLVLRTAKKGENAGNKFWGCSGFPKCWYRENGNP